MKLIIGLGNIGSRYENTKHNIGFMVLDQIFSNNSYNIINEKKFDAQIVKTKISNEDVIFVKPQTYMNLSGRSVQLIKSFYNVSLEDILIIYDDIDQDFNKLKFKQNGSHGGHNGIRSIISLLGTSNIARVKVGIGRHKFMPVDKWVLSKFSSEELKQLKPTFDKVEQFIYNFIEFGFQKACNGK